MWPFGVNFGCLFSIFIAVFKIFLCPFVVAFFVCFAVSCFNLILWICTILCMFSFVVLFLNTFFHSHIQGVIAFYLFNSRLFWIYLDLILCSIFILLKKITDRLIRLFNCTDAPVAYPGVSNKSRFNKIIITWFISELSFTSHCIRIENQH